MNGVPLKVTTTGLDHATLHKGGPSQVVTVTFDNNSGATVRDYKADFFASHLQKGRQAWKDGSLKVQSQTPSGWKDAPFGTARDMTQIVKLPVLQLAKGQKVTFHLRITATNLAPIGDYASVFSGGSAIEPDPHSSKDCIRWN